MELYKILILVWVNVVILNHAYGSYVPLEFAISLPENPEVLSAFTTLSNTKEGQTWETRLQAWSGEDCDTARGLSVNVTVNKANNGCDSKDEFPVQIKLSKTSTAIRFLFDSERCLTLQAQQDEWYASPEEKMVLDMSAQVQIPISELVRVLTVDDLVHLSEELLEQAYNKKRSYVLRFS